MDMAIKEPQGWCYGAEGGGRNGYLLDFILFHDVMIPKTQRMYSLG